MPINSFTPLLLIAFWAVSGLVAIPKFLSIVSYPIGRLQKIDRKGLLSSTIMGPISIIYVSVGASALL